MFRATSLIQIQQLTNDALTNHRVNPLTNLFNKSLQLTPEIKIIRSKEFIQAAINKVNFQSTEKYFSEFAYFESSLTFIADFFNVTHNYQSDIINVLSEKIEVKQNCPESGIIEIAFTDYDPQKAVKVVNALVNEYFDVKYKTFNRTLKNIEQYFAQQTILFKEKLDLAINHLDNFRIAHHGQDPTQEFAQLHEKIIAIEKKINQINQKIAEVTSRFGAEHAMINALNATLNQLNQELVNLNQGVNLIPDLWREFSKLNQNVEINTQLYLTQLNNNQLFNNQIFFYSPENQITPFVKIIHPAISNIQIYPFFVRIIQASLFSWIILWMIINLTNRMIYLIKK